MEPLGAKMKIIFLRYKNVSFLCKCGLAKPIKHNLITASVLDKSNTKSTSKPKDQDI
jgi:hypothetical protein